MEKYLSRKFIISVAAFLGSIGTSIAALTIPIPSVAAVGIVCSVASAALYAAIEANLDASRN